MNKFNGTKKLGWIGTELMGSFMCKNLLKHNLKIYLYTRTKSKAENLIQEGAQWVKLTPHQKWLKEQI